MSYEAAKAGGPRPVLSPKARAVMEMISQGHSYEQILAAYPALTYLDIFQAAAEVLTAASHDSASHTEALKRRHRRAYEPWTAEEEDQLRQLIADGNTVARIAGRLERDRGAIRSRIRRLGLVDRLSPEERERFERSTEREGSGGA